MERSALPVTGVVLAGGAGRRMGGVDKGLLVWRGRPLVSYALSILAGLPEILISANRSPEAYQPFGYRVVADAQPGFQGPLLGLQAAFAHARQPWVLTIPVDSPRLAADLVERLWGARTGTVSVVAGRSAHGPEPIICLCHRSAAAALDEYLATGGRAAHGWFRALPHAWLDLADEEIVNYNTPDDLKA
ncbi:MAG: molybdenum cofactor guanylyltransferase [Gammaproteobacteria bacterium]|nr:molybdenum cofactor guanylyltransferase [Gammaproteobacteria bacterium]